MSADFILNRDGWLDGSADDAEVRTITRLRFSILDDLLTRNVSKRGGGESEAINTSLLPLAEFISKNWWPLLYEPLRPKVTDAFRVRHRLDSGMRGYTFPPIAVWSGGGDTIVADWASFENPFATISFLASRPDEPIQLRRDAVEISLFDLIETVLDRIKGLSSDLMSTWDQIRKSIENPDEVAYCRAAGHLGLDPYDSDTIDLTEFADGMSETLFSDISEVVEVHDLDATTRWVRDSEVRLKLFPEIDLRYFGSPMQDNLNEPAWLAGQASAERLRANTGISSDNPRAAVGDLLGSLVADTSVLADVGPEGLTAIIRKIGSTARIGTVARSARQRRFRACAAAYLAWISDGGEDHAATEAFTRRQQASRAFAAEMLAPQQTLIARASRAGFDEEDLHLLASEFICPYETVMWQSVRADIPLRGFEAPRTSRPRVVTRQPAA